MKYINVATGSNVKALDRLFTYAVPPDLEELIQVGSIVEIPFGKANRIQRAYVVDTEDVLPEKGIEIKSIISVSQEHFLTPKQIELAKWMKQYYVATFASVIKLMVPPSFQVKIKKQISYFIKANAEELVEYQQKNKAPRFQKRMSLLDYFLQGNNSELPALMNQSFYSKAILDTLLKDGIIEKKEVMPSVLSPYKKGVALNKSKPVLTSEQKKVVEDIWSEKQGIHLVHGITGSGKTEIYFSLITKVLEEGKQAIVLLPEIALTFALVRRFIERFGDGIGLFHSRLSEGEKRAEWEKALSGQTKIMIGPRSALFAPLPNLGIIVIDEEHESTYKSDSMPKFHAIEVAAKMGKIYQIPIVLGSATPSIESYYYAKKNRFHLHQLKNKALTNNPIEVHLIDMRRELDKGNRSFLSKELETAIEDALAKQEQIILLNNRRGYAKFISCRKCGFVYKCPHCEMPMTYHKEPEHMECHHCGFTKAMQKVCPMCQSKYLKAFGMGTQKMEIELKKRFPNTPVIRMDYDTTRNKHGHDQKLQEFANAKTGILIGTQMIAKGLDFHNVTVVGVLAVDQGLYTDDFRASERSFQLLTQIIGRTGRGEKCGKAFIQTYSPEHFAIRTGMAQDFNRFFQEEIIYRRVQKNPPYSEILEIAITHERQKEAEKMATVISLELKDIIRKNNWNIELIGPSSPYLFKQAGNYRKIIILKANRHKELTFIMNYLYNKKIDKIGFGMYLDINPQFFF